jgi:hypothetical protein
MARYAAKLLFQFRVDVGGKPNKRRLCEERIILLQGKGPKECLRLAKKRGREARYAYKNTDDNPVIFEFVGVMDLPELGLECEPDEVWYEMSRKTTPMERRRKYIQPDSFFLRRLRPR